MHNFATTHASYVRCATRSHPHKWLRALKGHNQTQGSVHMNVNRQAITATPHTAHDSRHDRAESPFDRPPRPPRSFSLALPSFNVTDKTVPAVEPIRRVIGDRLLPAKLAEARQKSNFRPRHALGLARSAHPRPPPTVQRPQTSALLVLVFPHCRTQAQTSWRTTCLLVWRSGVPRHRGPPSRARHRPAIIGYKNVA
ncbi:hypothetical protein ACK3TF_003561 [Chlorella vulgaris]